MYIIYEFIPQNLQDIINIYIHAAQLTILYDSEYKMLNISIENTHSANAIRR